MLVFRYDKTFPGLLSAIFEAYSRKSFPDLLIAANEPLPLFHEEVVDIFTDDERADRVWKSLQKKLSSSALSLLTVSWLSELPEVDMFLFRYMRKSIDAPRSIELHFGDTDVLRLSQIGRKVSQERMRVNQFLRFQKTADNTYFAGIKPLYNVLPLVITHLKDRFSDQIWLIYDIKREYGYYYDLTNVTEVRFEEQTAHLLSGHLSPDLMAKDEHLYQQLWKAYFKATTIKERLNLKLHRQNMPARFWKYLIEKQS